MNLTPREKDKLLVAMAAMVARNRLERGVKLNYPEAIALISDLRGRRRARRHVRRRPDGDGAGVITRDQVMDGDRRDDPRDPGRSDLSRRHQAGHRARTDPLRGRCHDSRRRSFVSRRRDRPQRGPRDRHADRRQHRRPAGPGRLPLSFLRNQHGARIRPRQAAKGFRLDIPAGTAVRFEPGQTREVDAGAYAGNREVFGFNGLVNGPLEGTEPWRFDRSRRLCRHVRPDHGRQGASGRHRPLHRGRRRPDHLRRGGEVRRRQGHPRRHGPVARHPRATALSTR